MFIVIKRQSNPCRGDMSIKNMFKRLRYKIVSLLLLLSSMQAIAQIAMPDTVCIGTSRTYTVNDATVPSTYTWKVDGITQTATTNQLSITWNNPGVFLVTVQEHPQNGCDGDIRSGLVHVNPPPIANAGPDVTVCYGKPVQLTGTGGTQYKWSPTSYLSDTTIANPVAVLPAAGTYIYSLTVSNGTGCKSLKDDSIRITMLPQLKVFAGNDTSIALGQQVKLQAVDVNNSGFASYLWSPPGGLSNPAIPNPFTKPNRDITYTLKATTAAGCDAIASIKIKVFAIAEIYVPTAFTPNGDGINDYLIPIPVGIVQFKYFSVFNRYGQMVFTTTNLAKGWDGTLSGSKQNVGTYVWIVEGVDFNGTVIKKQGYAVLIR
jgi:gliding motility-associated-like protein